jgi:uncharacterized membrane protein YbhN (UPF0104 family)
VTGTVLTLEGGHSPALTALPAALAVIGMLVAVAIAWLRPEGDGRLRTAAAVLGAAVRDAIGHVRSLDPRLLGAFVWWGFDMAVLYGMLHAFGTAPGLEVVVFAYFVGQAANTIPIPGAVSGGLVGVLLAFGVEADLAIVSVLAYRAIAIWLPTPIGLAALGALRRTIGTWGREDSGAEVAVETVPPVADRVRAFPAERQGGWRPREASVQVAA